VVLRYTPVVKLLIYAALLLHGRHYLKTLKLATRGHLKKKPMVNHHKRIPKLALKSKTLALLLCK